MPEDDLIAVHVPYDFMEADAIRQHLHSLNIVCHLEGENQSSMAGGGFMGNTGRWRMRILALQEDAERVRRIIEKTKWPRYT